MKTKKLNILFASIFALVFLIGLASAIITLSATTPILIPQTSGTFNFSLTSDVNMTDTINFTAITITDSNGKTISFTTIPDTFYTFVAGVPQPYTMNYLVSPDFNFEFPNEYKTTLIANALVSTDATIQLIFEPSNFCKYNNLGELSVRIKDVKVTKGFGEDNDWYIFDEIEVELLIENDGNEDIDNIAIEWGLYNTQSKKWTIEVDDEKDFDLKDRDEKKFIIAFNLDNKLDEDLEDLEEGNYVLYVRATGEIAGGVYKGNNTCSSDSEGARLIVERDFVILKNIEAPEVVQCGSEVQILADVWNIGEDDQDEVTVNIYNKVLGLNENILIGDIDAFDSEPLDFIFQLPKDLGEKSYIIELRVYDEDHDIYESGNDDQSKFEYILKVEGGCAVAKASVTAVLESGGEAGKPLVVKATIVNTGDKTISYSLNAAGYAEWASSASLDKTSLTLDAGKSGEVLLTFNVNKDALGVKLFYLEVLAENKLIANQPVQIEITKKSGLGITGNFFSGDNKYIWGIGALNLILVILIIVIAVRISRKSKK